MRAPSITALVEDVRRVLSSYGPLMESELLHFLRDAPCPVPVFPLRIRRALDYLKATGEVGRTLNRSQGGFVWWLERHKNAFGLRTNPASFVLATDGVWREVAG